MYFQLSVQFSRSVMSDSLRPHESQHFSIQRGQRYASLIGKNKRQAPPPRLSSWYATHVLWMST